MSTDAPNLLERARREPEKVWWGPYRQHGDKDQVPIRVYLTGYLPDEREHAARAVQRALSPDRTRSVTCYFCDVEPASELLA